MKIFFTWWNKQTFGTLLKTLFTGKLVGRDEYGNRYYKNKNDERWVVYSSEIEATKITSDWYSWIHNITNNIPTDKKLNKFSWQKPHQANKTGTNDSFKPNQISKNNKKFKKYESWKP